MNELNDEIYEFKMYIVKEFFYNEDSSWGSYKIETESSIPYFKFAVKNSFSKLNNGGYEGSISGNMQKLEENVEYIVKGCLNKHQKYGYSIEPTYILPTIPKTRSQQESFLRSLITPKQADTLLQEYPNIVQNVMDGNCEIDFSKLKGITNNNFVDIKNKILENFVIADILSVLSPVGITFKMIKKITENISNPILLKQKLLENPYMLTSIDGLGFKKVDDIALKINPELKVSKFRAVSYMKYSLNEAGNNDGHLWLKEQTFKNNFFDNVPECEQFYEEIMKEQIEKSTFLHVENKEIGLKQRYEIESNIFDRLVVIGNAKCGYDITEEHLLNGISIANKEQGFCYDEEQTNNIKQCCKSKVIVLSGLAGSGKSTLARGILNVFKQANMSISCCALSARAGIVIKESTGFDASTIHRLFKIGMTEDDEAKDGFLQTDVLLIDEASMVNSYLLNNILSHTRNDTVVIIVGDDKQLPAIGYGSALRDLLSNGNNLKKLGCSIFFKRLNKIYRQAEKSGIIHDANIIRENKCPFDKIKNKMITGELKDMFYMFFNDCNDIHKEAINRYMSSVAKDGIENISMITPVKESGINCAKAFNEEIQELLLPDKPFVKYGDKKFREGAKVMQIRNDYDRNVFNGTEGYMISIEEKSCLIDFDGKIQEYSKSNLGDIQLSYCKSVHKMQGDSKQKIICVMDNSSSRMLDSCLLYTALTRAKKSCMVISTPYSFDSCIKHNKQIDRQTYLSKFLKNITIEQ